VEAIDRAIVVLKCFTKEEMTLSLAELSRRSGYYKSTLTRMLNSLEDGGLVVRHEDKSYSLGAVLMRLGSTYQSSLRLESLVRPALRKLVQAADESASLFRREGESRLCLFREESGHNVRDQVREGDFLPLGKGAAGQVLKDFDNITIHDSRLNELLSAMPRISYGERDPAAAGMAMPVFSEIEGLTGALTLSGPVTRFTEARLKMMEESLRESAMHLTLLLGGTKYWKAADSIR
jgi:DNA-binding IclR family transcriptional regulator